MFYVLYVLDSSSERKLTKKVLYFPACSVIMTTLNFQDEVQNAQNYVRMFYHFWHVQGIWIHSLLFSIWWRVHKIYKNIVSFFFGERKLERKKVFIFFNSLIHKIEGNGGRWDSNYRFTGNYIQKQQILQFKGEKLMQIKVCTSSYLTAL